MLMHRQLLTLTRVVFILVHQLFSGETKLPTLKNNTPEDLGTIMSAQRPTPLTGAPRAAVCALY